MALKTMHGCMLQSEDHFISATAAGTVVHLTKGTHSLSTCRPLFHSCRKWSLHFSEPWLRISAVPGYETLEEEAGGFRHGSVPEPLGRIASSSGSFAQAAHILDSAHSDVGIGAGSAQSQVPIILPREIPSPSVLPQIYILFYLEPGDSGRIYFVRRGPRAPGLSSVTIPMFLHVHDKRSLEAGCPSSSR